MRQAAQVSAAEPRADDELKAAALVKLAWEIYESAKSDRVAVTLPLLSALGNVVLSGPAHLDAMSTLLSEVGALRLQVDSAFVEILMNACVERGDSLGALHLLDFAQRSSGAPGALDIVSGRLFTSAVRVHANAGDVTGCADLLDRMRLSGFAWTEYTCSALLSLYAHEDVRDPQAALRVLQDAAGCVPLASWQPFKRHAQSVFSRPWARRLLPQARAALRKLPLRGDELEP